MTIAELKERHRDYPVKATVGEGGLCRLEIRTPLAEAQVYLHGAHVAHFQPAGHEGVLFMSSRSHFAAGKPIRGGVPVCHPWFGPKSDDPGAPMHGIARLQEWSLAGVNELPGGEVGITLVLGDSDLSRGYFPHPYQVEHRIRIGRELAMSLVTRNSGTEPFIINEALHTYFSVGDIHQVRLSGLENTLYMDKTRGMQRFTQNGEAIGFSGETDRHYLNTSNTTIIHDGALQRRIVVRKSGSRSTVVWNPWIDKARAMPDFGDDEWQRMLCVETANAADNAVGIAPGDEHEMQAIISVERG